MFSMMAVKSVQHANLPVQMKEGATGTGHEGRRTGRHLLAVYFLR
jgi:hypothetical protein